MCCFRTRNLLLSKKCVPLHCVFHSIRFKVNKGWSTAVLLFLCLYLVSLFNEIVTPFHTFVFLYSSALAGGRGYPYIICRANIIHYIVLHSKHSASDDCYSKNNVGYILMLFLLYISCLYPFTC